MTHRTSVETEACCGDSRRDAPGFDPTLLAMDKTCLGFKSREDRFPSWSVSRSSEAVQVSKIRS